jgi:uncharacterized membrane protein
MSRLLIPLLSAALASSTFLVGAGAAASERAPESATQPMYRLTTLEPLAQGNASYALGLNERGRAVGTARNTTSSRPQLAARWDGDEPIDLGTLEGSTFSRAFDINAAGLAVGEAFTRASESSRAVAWTPSGELQHVGSLNPQGTGVANDVNDRGQVVGASHNGTYVRAFLGRVGAVRELPVPEAEGPVGVTRANAIARDGSVAGVSYVTHDHGDHTHSVAQATHWKQNSAEVLDGTGEDHPSIAYDLNERSVVVGEERIGTDWHAVQWSDGLPTVLPGLPGLRHTRAVAVNNSGAAVGYATGFYGFATIDGRAILWSEGRAHDLNDLVELPAGHVLRAASDINEKGAIVGSMSTPDGVRGFLLKPRSSS